MTFLLKFLLIGMFPIEWEHVSELRASPLTPPQQSLSITPVSEAEIVGAILTITSNALRPDKVPIKLLLATLSAIISIITAIFNYCLLPS